MDGNKIYTQNKEKDHRVRRYGEFKDFFFLKKKVYHGSVDLARVDPPLLYVPIERPAAEDMEAICHGPRADWAARVSVVQPTVSPRSSAP